jgi:hypothetical protein
MLEFLVKESGTEIAIEGQGVRIVVKRSAASSDSFIATLETIIALVKNKEIAAIEKNGEPRWPARRQG